MWNWEGEWLLPEGAKLVSVTRGVIHRCLLHLVTLVWTWHSKGRTTVLPPLCDDHFGYNTKRPYVVDLFQQISYLFKMWHFYTKMIPVSLRNVCSLQTPETVQLLRCQLFSPNFLTENKVELWLLTGQCMGFDCFTKLDRSSFFWCA